MIEPFIHNQKVDDRARTFQYQVRAVNSTAAESWSSFSGTASPGGDRTPAQPAGVRTLWGPDAGQVTVVCGGSAGGDLAGYRAYRKERAACRLVTQVIFGVATRTQPIEGLRAGRYYTFACLSAQRWRLPRRPQKGRAVIVQTLTILRLDFHTTR